MRNGFTLVELLAVIVILAIIMIIAIPAVLYTLSNAQRSSFEKYVLKVIDLVEQKELSNELLSVTASRTCLIYNIKNDLDLSNTGSYDSYVLVSNAEDGKNYVITMWDDNYMLLPYNYTKKLNSKSESIELNDAISKYDESKKDDMSSSKLCGYGCTECSSPQKEVIASGCKYSVGQTFNFGYTGGTQSFNPECDGKYKLEVWGAQGGTNDVYTGGLGGYSAGTKELTTSSTIYVVVGGTNTCSINQTYVNGGYNGGGAAKSRSNSIVGCPGGGATHIGEINATLAETGEDKLSTVYIIAGGGGGAGWFSGNATYLNNGSDGGAGGGLNGLVPSNRCSDCGTRTGGSQTAGGKGRAGTGTFGQGVSSCNGGGGGLYGGGADTFEWGGYGGSGYIDGVLDGTTTAGINEGNGKATITYLG